MKQLQLIWLLGLVFAACKTVNQESFSKSITSTQGLKQECTFGDTDMLLKLVYMESIFILEGKLHETAKPSTMIVKSNGSVIAVTKETPVRYYSLPFHQSERSKMKQLYDYWVMNDKKNPRIRKWFRSNYKFSDLNSHGNYIAVNFNITLNDNSLNFQAGSHFRSDQTEKDFFVIPGDNEDLFKSPLSVFANIDVNVAGESVKVDTVREWYGVRVFPKEVTFRIKGKVATFTCSEPEPVGWDEIPKINNSNLVDRSPIIDRAVGEIEDTHLLNQAGWFLNSSTEAYESVPSKIEDAFRIYCTDFIKLTSTSLDLSETKLEEMLRSYFQIHQKVSLLSDLTYENGESVLKLVGKSGFEKSLWNGCITDNFPQYRM